MSLFIVDTDTWTLWLMRHPLVLQQVAAHKGNDLAIAVITAEELLSGWYTSLRRARKRDDKIQVYLALTETVQQFRWWRVLTFSEPAMDRADQLIGMKLNVGKKDLCIAAITLEHGGTLVTRNRRDFQRVPGLALEDWSV